MADLMGVCIIKNLTAQKKFFIYMYVKISASCKLNRQRKQNLDKYTYMRGDPKVRTLGHM